MAPPPSSNGTSPKAEPWASVDEVAAHLGVRKDSVYRWIEHRGLPAKKIGKLWKLKLSEVDAWVRARGADDEPPATTALKSGRGKAAPGARAGRPLVLVVDDEQLVLDTVSEFLADEGYAVRVASDGARALALLRSAKELPAVIVLDLKMPNLDGWGFREEQARDPALASIPVVVVTATRSTTVRGAAAVLRKPLRLPLLGQAIAAVLPARTEEDT